VAAADCLFCKIVRGEIPSRKVYEDADIFAFHDIHPFAPVHFMIIPKQHIASLADCDASHQGILGKLIAAAPRLAREQGSTDGFRLIINTGVWAGRRCIIYTSMSSAARRPWARC